MELIILFILGAVFFASLSGKHRVYYDEEDFFSDDYEDFYYSDRRNFRRRPRRRWFR